MKMKLISGIGVLGWKRIMSRRLFRNQRAAQRWVMANGIDRAEYIKASMTPGKRK